MKGINTKFLLKVMSPQVMTKAVETFDRATLLIVGASWAAAAMMIVFTIYTLNLTVAAKKGAEAAAAAEPVLPKIVRKKVEAKDVQSMVDRFQHRFPNVSITFHGNLKITASSGAEFHNWLNVVSYVDSVSPQLHWNLQEFCVGHCPGNELMQATLVGEKIAFEKPQLDTKNDQ